MTPAAKQADAEMSKNLAEYIASSTAPMPAPRPITPAVVPEDPTTQLNRLAAAQRYGVNPGSFGSLGGVHGYGE